MPTPPPLLILTSSSSQTYKHNKASEAAVVLIDARVPGFNYSSNQRGNDPARPKTSFQRLASMTEMSSRPKWLQAPTSSPRNDSRALRREADHVTLVKAPVAGL